VRGKNVVLGLLVAIFGVFALLIWIGVTGGSTHVPPSAPGVGFVKNETGPVESAAAPGAGPMDGGPIGKTVFDRRVRDELRRRILAGWAAQANEPEVAAAARQGRFAPAPTTDAGGMDPKYIQEVVRGEFFPLAGKCYEELLSRKDAGGRLEMTFTIVADESLGGIVEDVELTTDGGLADERMVTCMKESMSTVAFRSPAHGGYATVTYPIDLAP